MRWPVAVAPSLLRPSKPKEGRRSFPRASLQQRLIRPPLPAGRDAKRNTGQRAVRDRLGATYQLDARVDASHPGGERPSVIVARGLQGPEPVTSRRSRTRRNDTRILRGDAGVSRSAPRTPLGTRHEQA